MRMPQTARGRSSLGAQPAGTSPAAGSDADGRAEPDGPARDPQAPGGGAAASTVDVRGAGTRPGPAAGAGTAAAPAVPASRLAGVLDGARGSAARLPALLLRHWLAAVLVSAGLALRVLTEMAYHPAIVYIDSLKYLYGNWPGSDPIGYKIPLRLILAVGDLGTVTVIQHLLGLAIAVALYALLVRRGAPRWLAALAIAPVLLDAYQLQVEAMIMPDVWFEAMIVAGAAVLHWQPAPRLRAIIAAGVILGLSAGIRQVGEIMIVPALVLLIAAGGGWRRVLKNSAAMTGAFGLAVLLYLGASLALTGHFWLSESSTSLTYGRMASVADCATLKIPPVERPLCPTAAEQAWGPDKLQHGPQSPYRLFTPPPTLSKNALVASFNRSVERQQPLRVLSGIGHDAVKLFGPRVTRPGDTPIWRWQFQGNFPSYDPYVLVQHNAIIVSLTRSHGLPPVLQTLDPAYGGAPQVDRSIATFLRHYQLGGGYTPGPLLLLFTITGLAGSLLAIARRRPTARQRELALSCLLFFGAAVAVLAMSDAFEFTWRYQLPALVTLPPAGALGIAALISLFRRPGSRAGTDTAAPQAPELATPAG